MSEPCPSRLAWLAWLQCSPFLKAKKFIEIVMMDSFWMICPHIDEDIIIREDNWADMGVIKWSHKTGNENEKCIHMRGLVPRWRHCVQVLQELFFERFCWVLRRYFVVLRVPTLVKDTAFKRVWHHHSLGVGKTYWNYVLSYYVCTYYIYVILLYEIHGDVT